jgi:hypothetical protein
MIGETDFGGGKSRVGTGRTYVKLAGRPVGDPGYRAWIDGIKAGQLYFGDGRSHLIDFHVNEQSAGVAPLRLAKPGRVTLSVAVAARLDETPYSVNDERLTRASTYWHLERARIGSSRKVLIEVVVNGQAVEHREVLADGTLRTLLFSVDMPRSSWIALRILPSVHSAPVFVLVADRPVRASRRSAQWCLDCVDVLWRQHSKRIRESERAAAAAAWDHSRTVYRAILNECTID